MHLLRSRVRGIAALLCLCASALAAELNGIIKDPSGAAVPGAIVVIRSSTGQEQTAKADARGAFKFGIPDGAYTVRVIQAGFADHEQSVVISGKNTVIVIELKLAELRQVQEVSGRTTLANADPLYRTSRDAALKESFVVENLVIKRDVGNFVLKRGSVSFTAPVAGRVTSAVFVGEGSFSLTPVLVPEKNYLRSITGKDGIEETFARALFIFTDATYEEIRKSVNTPASEPRAQDAFADLRRRIRQRTEDARSFVEYLLEGESMANVDADIVADLYNPKQPGFFSAYIDGQKYTDLRFHVKPRGVLPQLPSPEEIGLIHVSPGGNQEGILYLAHYAAEYDNGKASSHEDKRVAAAEHYKIETVIGNNDRLTSVAEIRFRCVNDGDRIVKFDLLPNLRVSRVTAEGGSEIPFIQQSRKEDGSFYVVLPAAMKAGTSYTITTEYAGDKVVEKAGGGNFAVGARTSWYPSLNSFTDRSTFDLTFKIPKRYTMVGVGKLVKESKEQDFAVSQWVSEVPLAVAGFNFGDFKAKQLEDPKTKYMIEGYATSELPDYLHGARDIGGMTPTRMLDKGMSEAQVSIQLFEHWFGRAPYGRIAVTQQPQMSFGQSWPTLVYLPLIAFFDSTQRWQLMGDINRKVTEFVEEVTPHEVAHQWWGHMVGWASYRDQWLSEGLANFSAGLFLQAIEPKMDRFLKYWDRARETILEKNKYGMSANEAGPIWMGLRLNTFKNQGAYSRVAYDKGAYVVHMLRQMMWSRETGDERFRKMMHDFVGTHLHKNASTETFAAIVEKHMIPEMDLEGNKRMDWFFRQWVYDTEVPRYKLDYTVTPQDGKFLLTAKLTQSEVSNGFMMIVPIYVDFDGRPIRLGGAKLYGNATVDLKVALPKKPKAVLVNAYHDVLARK